MAPLHEEDRDVRTLVEESHRFWIKLFDRILKKEGGWDQENVFISPWSISAALKMARNGSFGETRKQMNQVLGLNELPDARSREAMKKLSPPSTERATGLR